MTISANATFDPQADQITTTALVMAQMLHPGHEADAGLLSHGRTIQNLAAKAIQNDGVSVRVMERVNVTVTEGTFTITPDTDTEDVVSGYWTDTSGFDHELGKLSLLEYDNLANKTATNAPPSFFVFDKANGAARLRLWPPVDTTVASVTYVRRRRLRDMDDGSVTLDLPSSWQLAFTYKVASMLSVVPGRAEYFEGLYEKEKARASMADTETGPVRFVPGESIY